MFLAPDEQKLENLCLVLAERKAWEKVLDEKKLLQITVNQQDQAAAKFHDAVRPSPPGSLKSGAICWFRTRVKPDPSEPTGMRSVSLAARAHWLSGRQRNAFRKTCLRTSSGHVQTATNSMPSS